MSSDESDYSVDGSEGEETDVEMEEGGEECEDAAVEEIDQDARAGADGGVVSEGGAKPRQARMCKGGLQRRLAALQRKAKKGRSGLSAILRGGSVSWDKIIGNCILDEEGDDEADTCGWQKELWQHKKLPYYAEMEKEADAYFRDIKAGLAHAVLLNDTRAGLLHWLIELEKYISLYSKRFSKADHIQLVKLLYSFIHKDNLTRELKVCAHLLNALLNKRDLISRSDMVLDWRPLYDLYVVVQYKNLEEDGIFLMPEGFKSELNYLVSYSRNYFSDDAPREMLDELRPWMCPWDESLLRAFKLLEMFMPMTMTPAVQDVSGAVLWKDEMWHWFTAVENNSGIEPKILRMFAKLEYECPGYMKWTPEQLDLIFTKMLRSLKLGPVVGLCQEMHMDTVVTWITYMMGGQNGVQSYVGRLLRIVESFLHPSNYGSHSTHLLNCLHKLCHHLVLRLKRERSHRPPTFNPVPAELKLTQDHIDEFVRTMLPCVKLAIFTKVKHEYVSLIVRDLVAVAPKIILPAVLEIVYPALETVTEPHRLTQALQCLLAVSVQMARDVPAAGSSEDRSHRQHCLMLVEALMPALDRNDIGKSMLTFQIVGVLVNLVPLVDCSEAVYQRSDLNDDEKELCSATANTENIVCMLVHKMLSMVELSVGDGGSAHGSLLARNAKYSMEETIIIKGCSTLFKGITSNSSTRMYKLATDRLYSWMCDNVFDSRVVAETIGDMMYMAVRYYPSLSFVRFFDLILNRLDALITADMYDEDHLEFAVIWWLSMASKLIKVDPTYLLAHEAKVIRLLDTIVPLRCKTANKYIGHIVEDVLSQLCSVLQAENFERRKTYDKPVEEWVAVRNWARAVDKKQLVVDWHVPSADSIRMATTLLDKFVWPKLKQLETPDKYNKNDLYRMVSLVDSALSGAAFSLPQMGIDDELIPLKDSPTFVNPFHFVCKPDGTPEISGAGGANVREAVCGQLLRLLDWMVAEREGDTKTIHAIMTALGTIVFGRGVDKTTESVHQQNYSLTRQVMADRIKGAKADIEPIVRDQIGVFHMKRVTSRCGYFFTQHHLNVCRALVKVATSTYSENRVVGQSALQRMMKDFPYLYLHIIDDVLKFVEPGADVTYEQFKGAMYILVDGKRLSLMLRQRWDNLAKLWPAVIRASHSERPSINNLLEQAQNTVVDMFESFRITETCPEAAVPEALKLYSVGDERHAPSRDVPSEEERKLADHKCQQRNEENARNYSLACDRLLGLASDSSLHWRHADMAHSYLSLLIRKDVPFPSEAVRMFVRLLVHDTVKTRKMALGVIGAWLKITKPKAAKKEYVIENKDPNTGCGAVWPIKYGIREDNRCMLYDEDALPKTDEEWDAAQFCGKSHWGFYTWPQKLVTYAPLGEQAAVNRPWEELTETEQYICNMINEQEFSDKMKAYLTIEEKKGEEFNAVTFAFFQGIFRSFGAHVLPAMKRHVEQLLASEKESEQKLAAELVAGLINGSKMWYHKASREMWEWLDPILFKALENVKDDAVRNWGVCIATVCGASEARLLVPLIKLVLRLLDNQTESAVLIASHMFFVQGAVCQFEWRALSLWYKLIARVGEYVTQSYENIRNRLAITLVTFVWFDLPSVSVCPQLPAHQAPPKLDMALDMIEKHLDAVWEETGLRGGDASGSGDASATSVSAAEMRRHPSRLALKTLVQFLYNYAIQAFVAPPIRIVHLMPLLAHFTNDLGDEELKQVCTTLFRDILAASLVLPHHMPHYVNMFSKQLRSGCWWKARVAMLKFVKMNVFSNQYVYLSRREEIGQLITECMADAQIEVREAAAEAFSGLVHCGYFECTKELISAFCSSAQQSEERIRRHAGVLGLAACVLAFPYSVPDHLPHTLMRLCRHASDRGETRETVKKTLAEFKRTHQDSWHEHKQAFSDDQLTVLTDLLVSPNYYV